MKKIFIVGIIIIFVGATIFSIYKFKVINPIASCIGMLQILFTNKEYVIVQNFPQKVMFAKPTSSLFEYMEKQGFEVIPEESMGVYVIFSDGTESKKAYTSTN